ncbi:hypothetical protein NG791_05425 [Laspinema sp. D1]|uniref:hypothetical protein n=1 Tax=Laspinema palackyanum TaxID=3231601 RepID=UPI0034802791|nr:hypothetical protein [Laspinema sp. D2b]
MSWHPPSNAPLEESDPVPKPALKLLMVRVMADAMTRGNDFSRYYEQEPHPRTKDQPQMTKDQGPTTNDQEQILYY